MSRPIGDASYREVRGLSRGLLVLRALNQADGGQASATALAAATGLHRTTVRRLLETLVANGVARRSTSDDSFRLALGARTLSDGFKDDTWVSQVAAPIMGELLQQVSWPADLSTPDGAAMVVRESTHRFSRFSFHRNMVGTRLPMLHTAAGRAYLAHCAATDRSEILRMLQADEPGFQVLSRSPQRLARLLQQIRTNGYATNDREWTKEPNFSAVALPILRENVAIGALNLIFVAQAMPIHAAVQRYVPALRRAAARISDGVVK